ncbi:EsaB/YukD family protein [Lentibacillus sp. Marseille-P4043]|uniref:EsaB/YukD family protein n=1 Tax=Lentibacillus sp. Marseille-P4043 TaxID=2040293 RepID=UPI000D0B34E4|nr:EsaB/YukD family protein [Lentibacillus sp. Marseille-P4043]
MPYKTHIDVTIDFTSRRDAGLYDLRIPVQLTVKQLLLNVIDTLKLGPTDSSAYTIKIITKNLLLADDDMLMDYPITDGDILTVL